VKVVLSASKRIGANQRADLKKRPLNFDFVGLSLLALTLVCWEIVLSNGILGLLHAA
jgi:hypothetical protein